MFAGRFTIERTAGEGGMGLVYQARDHHTGDQVALKVLHDALGPGVGAERFTREAGILAGLRHPGVVAHVDHGCTDAGERYLAMEWLAGEDLARRIARGGPLPLQDALTLVRSVAAGLAAAHERGVVHRDLKPTNIFLVDGAVDRTRILDFGVARDLESPHALTRTGIIVGTPEYMAPEQARGQPDIDPAADVFSLGCVLYECLAGQPPFLARHVAAVLVRVLFDDPAPLGPHVPPAVAQLLDRMLAKDPAARPRDAVVLSALLANLDATAHGGPPPPPRPRVGGEQQLFSVVLAAGPTLADDATPDLAAQHAHRASLEAALADLGVVVVWLQDGSLVVTQATTGSATDQALKAARLALAVQERWPEATVVLATGRGVVHRTTPVGEVIDRATAILADRRTTPAINARKIWLDDTSAGLLERRFAVDSERGFTFLAGGETSVDEAHQLLGKPTPCVGREQELTTLAAVLASCVEESEPRAVLVTAPAGAGKSRLRHEFLRRAAHPGLTVLLGVGDMMRAGSPYAILGAALRRLCGVAGGEPVDIQQARLAARLGEHVAEPERAHVAEFLGELCGVPAQGEPSLKLRAARHDPRIMRDLIAAAFVDWLAAEARHAPVVLVLEDLHWGDALAVQLVDRALRELPAAPFLILALARPDVHEPFPNLWSGHALKRLPLAGLGRKACERLVHEVLGKDVPADVVARLYTQSGGNALFLEEFIRAVRDGKADTLPGTVLAMLQARIGRLDLGVQRSLLAAAVLGPTFWAGGVRALLADAGRGDDDIATDLRHLLADELVERHATSRFAGEAEYAFRHALLREAAYSLLADDHRAAAHRRAAAWLAAFADADPMVVAEQFRRAGEPARALPYFVRAAVQAFDSNDFAETLARVDAGLACDPDGEDLGVLLGLRCNTCFWTNDLAACHLAGTRALPLLAPASRHWCHAMIGLLNACLVLPQAMPEFPALVAAVMATPPRPDGAAAHFEALSFVVITTTGIGQRAIAEPCLDSMLQTAAAAAPRDLQLDAETRHAATFHALFLRADPWRTRTIAAEMLAAAAAIGLYRLVGMARCYLGLAELQMMLPAGDRAVRDGLELMRSRKETLSELFFTALLAAHVADHDDDADALDRMTAPLLDRADANAFVRGLTHGARASLHLRRGDPDAAEADAAAADELLRTVPPAHAFVLSPWIRAALARGAVDEARARAEAGLRVLAAMGGGGPAEVKLRLAAAEAFAAADDRPRAVAELAAAVRQIHLRADAIADPDVRARFLAHAPENRRARDLDAAWSST